MVEDLFSGWKTVYFFEGATVGSRLGFLARSYPEAVEYFEDYYGYKPSKLVGLEIK